MRKTLAATALIIGAALGVSSCAGNPDDAGAGAGAETSSRFNDADIAFATGMIPHHEQAVEMAELAADRAGSDQVRRLAEDIEAAQGPEIETMTGWLDDWGQEAPSGSMDHGDMGHGGTGSGMTGMMTGDEMNMLEDADGAEFDRMFLEMMIRHHEGAIDMARTEQADGENPDAIALAKQIETDQESEIATMKQLLDS